MEFGRHLLFKTSLPFFLAVFFGLAQGSRVLELTNKLIEIRKDSQWFVMFYAPWCGHCKRLEPIWSQVAQDLYNTNVRVGKLDCTRFTEAATEFNVNGFPTILFIKYDQEFMYKGDRNREDMVNFALRLTGPPVQQITKPDSIGRLKELNDLFFVFVGESVGQGWEAYYNVAQMFQPYGFFYSTPSHLVKHHYDIKSEPTIFVYKEKTTYFFEGDHESEDFNITLRDWVNEERFKTFPKVTRGNLHQFYQINKYIVLAVLEENRAEEIPPDMLEFRDLVESVIRSNRNRYHKRFQFGWVGSPELANSIAMSVLPLPHLIVVNTSTRHHHFPDHEISQLTKESLIGFLDRVHNMSAPVFGGNSWWVRLYGMYFDLRISLIEMWHGNPVLTCLLFGLPLGFLSLICYSICCSDIMDADEEEEQPHEKGE